MEAHRPVNLIHPRKQHNLMHPSPQQLFPLRAEPVFRFLLVLEGLIGTFHHST